MIYTAEELENKDNKPKVLSKCCSRFEKKTAIRKKYWGECLHVAVDYVDAFSNLRTPKYISDNLEIVENEVKNDKDEIISKGTKQEELKIERGCYYFVKENKYFKNIITELDKEITDTKFVYKAPDVEERTKVR